MRRTGLGAEKTQVHTSVGTSQGGDGLGQDLHQVFIVDAVAADDYIHVLLADRWLLSPTKRRAERVSKLSRCEEHYRLRQEGYQSSSRTVHSTLLALAL